MKGPNLLHKGSLTMMLGFNLKAQIFKCNQVLILIPELSLLEDMIQEIHMKISDMNPEQQLL